MFAGDKGSMCNKFRPETDSSSLSNGQEANPDSQTDDPAESSFDTLENETTEDGNGDGNGSKNGNDKGNLTSKRRKRPPKIWISKSASMEHDLD